MPLISAGFNRVSVCVCVTKERKTKSIKTIEVFLMWDLFVCYCHSEVYRKLQHDDLLQWTHSTPSWRNTSSDQTQVSLVCVYYRSKQCFVCFIILCVCVSSEHVMLCLLHWNRVKKPSRSAMKTNSYRYYIRLKKCWLWFEKQTWCQWCAVKCHTCWLLWC